MTAKQKPKYLYSFYSESDDQCFFRSPLSLFHILCSCFLACSLSSFQFVLAAIIIYYTLTIRDDLTSQYVFQLKELKLQCIQHLSLFHFSLRRPTTTKNSCVRIIFQIDYVYVQMRYHTNLYILQCHNTAITREMHTRKIAHFFLRWHRTQLHTFILGEYHRSIRGWEKNNKQERGEAEKERMCEKQTSVTSNDRETHKFKLVVSIYDAHKWECSINYELISCNATPYFKSKCWLNAWMTTMTTTITKTLAHSIEVGNRRLIHTLWMCVQITDTRKVRLHTRTHGIRF